MARNRMLNPEFWLDEELAQLSPRARLLYMGLWGICDDNFATFPDRPDWIKAQVFPYEEVNTRELLDELSNIKKIIKFSYEGHVFWYLKNFFKHQRVDRPSKPKYPEYKPDLEILVEPSSSTRSEVKLSKEKIREDKLSIASDEHSPTPKEESYDFFSGGETYENLKKQFSVKIDPLLVEREFRKFLVYWSEKNKSGTKQRWEQQQTFEVKKRLFTWFNNIRGNNSSRGKYESTMV